jgi:predicted DNA-binding protein with PD1-like motif
MSRLLLARLEAGADLHEGIETLARAHDIRHALIRGGPGSLMRAALQAGGDPVEAPGPAAEILTLVGEINDGIADLHGTVGDPEGRVYAGRFLRGRNPVCITVELAIEDLEPP